MTIGERISKELHDKGMTQRELAEKVGISEVSISRYVNEGRQPMPMALGQIAKALGVTTDYLIGIDEVDDEEKGAEA